MTVIYADSSALVKRHVVEIGSAWIAQLFGAAQRRTIITSRFSTVEVISALNRRRRDGTITATDYSVLRDDFLALCRRDYRIVPISNAFFDRTRLLLEQHPLRSYDALHLASALIVNGRLLATAQPPLIFLAADNNLLAAAVAEGLTVDNPNNHP